MPALLPPSMQIGALPQGASTTIPVGPALLSTINAPVAPGNIVQQAGASTSVSGPTNITQTITATRGGSYLVWVAAVNASAGAALGGTPTGWTLLQSQAVATLALGVYVYPRNPGALTAVTFSSAATATTGGIASWFWEVANAPYNATTSISANGSSTAPAAGSQTSQGDCALFLAAIGWVLGTATLSAFPAGWVTQAQQSSTAGTTNAAIQVGLFAGVFGAAATQSFSATLSASSVWAAGELVLPSTASGQFNTEANQGYNADQLGPSGGTAMGIAGWGMGFTKPGGAGGGQ